MDFRELTGYQKAFETAMEIFYLSKSFPVEERYSLTDQIRRSSRSVCANFAEAYRKRRYVNHFISKLTDCDAENSETNVNAPSDEPSSELISDMLPVSWSIR